MDAVICFGRSVRRVGAAALVAGLAAWAGCKSPCSTCSLCPCRPCEGGLCKPVADGAESKKAGGDATAATLPMDP